MMLHADLFVASMARSLAFYVDQLGLQIIEDVIIESDLVRFLSDADRAKFDDREGLQPPLPGSAPEWLARFVSSSEPAAGARSMIKGK